MKKSEIAWKIGAIRAALRDGDIKGVGLTPKQIDFAREYAIDSHLPRACNAVGIAEDQGEAWLSWRHVVIVIEAFRDFGRVTPEVGALDSYTAESLVRRVYGMLARCESAGDVEGFLKLAGLEYKRLGLLNPKKGDGDSDEDKDKFVFPSDENAGYDPLEMGKRREMPSGIARALGMDDGEGGDALALSP